MNRHLLWGLVFISGCCCTGILERHVGFSGMARVKPNTYLVVHDTKANKDFPRLGLLSVDAGKSINYRELSVKDWADPEGRSSDLESVCGIGDSEFLVAESGYWEGAFGRLFHLRLQLGQPREVQILHVAKLPMLKDNSETRKGDNFEGLACKVTSDGKVLLLLGERGGSAAYKTGFIRWGYYDRKLGKPAFKENGLEGIPVSPPADFMEPGARSIASLHLTEEGELWASATKDSDDMGPFESLVYRIGTVDSKQEVPVKVEKSAHSYAVHGFKVEAIAESDLPGSKLGIATEDENLGGTWRALSSKK